MGIVWDLVLVGVCVLFVAIGARRGFIRSAAHFLGTAIAACFAALLGGVAAQWVFDTFFRSALAERVGDSLASLGNGDTFTAVQQVFASLPEFLLRALEAAGITAPGHDAAASPESASKATVKLKENVRKAGHGYAILEENGPACPAEIRREMRC